MAFESEIADDNIPLNDSPAVATILVIDDEEAVRKVLARSLERGGYRVTATGSGEDAIEQWNQMDLKPQLAVVDLCMPGMGGKELALVLRLLQPGLRILFISGAGTYVIDDALGAIRDSHALVKPFRVEQLLTAVDSALSGQLQAIE